jgi:hypothetical protein
MCLNGDLNILITRTYKGMGKTIEKYLTNSSLSLTILENISGAIHSSSHLQKGSTLINRKLVK